MEKPHSILKVNLVDSSNAEISPATQATLLTIDTSLSNIDGNITACDTTLLATEASVSGMSAKLPSALGQTTKSASVSVCLASDSDALTVDVNNRTNKGSATNFFNNETVNMGTSSSTLDVSTYEHGHLFINDSSTGSVDAYKLQVSPDSGTTWYDYTELWPSVVGSVRQATYFDINLKGFTDMRLTNSSVVDNYANVYAGIVGY